MSKKLKLSSDKMILGVCGGLAEYIGMDATVMRIIWVVLFFMGTLGFWAYIICYIIMYLSNK